MSSNTSRHVVCRLLGGAGRVVEHDRGLGMAQAGQFGGHALHTFGQGFEFSTTHGSSGQRDSVST